MTLNFVQAYHYNQILINIILLFDKTNWLQNLSSLQARDVNIIGLPLNIFDCLLNFQDNDLIIFWVNRTKSSCMKNVEK